jgi:hypothetical protein
MIDEHEDEHEHEDGPDADEEIGLELDVQSQIFLEMRRQNLELLKIAAQVAGYAGGHGLLKGGDLEQAAKRIWDLYAEFYSWVDPEESGDEEGDEE